ncbi:hypothetical protein D3C73_1185170 [compost metagenome]
MAHFMRQREHAVQVVVMVQQHIRVGAVSSPAVSSGAFIFVLIDINPAVVVAFLQHFEVVFAKRLQTFLSDFFGFLKRNIELVFIHQRREQIVHM